LLDIWQRQSPQRQLCLQPTRHQSSDPESWSPNVLAGDMSIVGPCPHAVAQNEVFAELISSVSRRHNVGELL
jgi:hypothetical protein